MRGHIRKRGPESWEILIYDKIVDGTRKYIPYSGFKTRKEAEKALPDILKMAEKGMLVTHSRMKLSEYLDVWLTDYVAKSVTGGTEDKYKAAANLAKEIIGHHQLQKIGPAEIQHFINQIEYRDTQNGDPVPRAASTIESYYNALKSAFTVAKKWRLISENPCHDVLLPKQKKQPMKTYTKEQVTLLLEEAEDSVIYLPLLLYVSCGLRRGEALGLKWRDVDLDNRVIQIQESYTESGRGVKQGEPKTSGSHRSVDFSDSVKRALEAQRTEQEKLIGLPDEKITDLKERKKALRDKRKAIADMHVCTWPDNQPVRPGYVTKEFSRICHGAGLEKIRLHDLRHTHATLLLQAGVHPKVVQERLGHSDISITLNTYSHVTKTMQREAADLMNF